MSHFPLFSYLKTIQNMWMTWWLSGERSLPFGLLVWKRISPVFNKRELGTDFVRSLYPPQTMFVGGYTVFTLSVRPNDRPTVRP